jgi:hypothetical protein
LQYAVARGIFSNEAGLGSAVFLLEQSIDTILVYYISYTGSFRLVYGTSIQDGICSIWSSKQQKAGTVLRSFTQSFLAGGIAPWISLLTVGTAAELEMLWKVSDIFNGLMRIPDLMCIWQKS